MLLSYFIYVQAIWGEWLCRIQLGTIPREIGALWGRAQRNHMANMQVRESADLAICIGISKLSDWPASQSTL